MPVKHRTAKRHAFNEYHVEQLLIGPDGCLIAGAGYLAGRSWFREMNVEQKAEVLAEMDADWKRQGPALLRWFAGDDAALSVNLKPWQMTRESIGDEPWALTEFGAP